MKQLVYICILVTSALVESCAQDTLTREHNPFVHDSIHIYKFNRNILYDQEPTVFKKYIKDSVVCEAKKYLGIPYKEQGKHPDGFDCSGFTFYIHKQFGVYLPDNAQEMAALGILIETHDAKPGDLIFFKGHNEQEERAGHVGIVVSTPGKPVRFIHSSSSKGIRYDFLDTNPYFKPRFIFVRRIIE